MRWLLNKDLKEVRELAMHIYGRKNTANGNNSKCRDPKGECTWHILGTSRRLVWPD